MKLLKVELQQGDVHHGTPLGQKRNHYQCKFWIHVEAEINGSIAEQDSRGVDVVVQASDYTAARRFFREAADKLRQVVPLDDPREADRLLKEAVNGLPEVAA